MSGETGLVQGRERTEPNKDDDAEFRDIRSFEDLSDTDTHTNTCD
jgi:hypothetical protein